MNKIYNLVWNYLSNSWAVTSELSRHGKKAAVKESVDVTDNQHTQKSLSISGQEYPLALRKTLQSTLLATLSLYGVNSFAISASDCTALGSSCVVVRTASELANALGNSGTATTILLGNDITLAGNITAQMLNSNRQNITIDGGGFNLNTGVYEFNVLGNSSTKWGNTLGSLNFKNFNTLSSTTAWEYTLVRAEPNMGVNVGFDNIQNLTDSMYTIMGVKGAGGTPNLKGEVVYGNLGHVNLTYGTNHQFGQQAKIRFTGDFSLTAPGNAGAYNTVFWSNAPTIENKMTFDSAAHVDIRATYLTLVNGNLNNNAFQYDMADGAYFKLRTPQNVFGSNNAGLQLGSYSSTTGFGSGVVLDVAGYNGEAVAGHGISNIGGDLGVVANGRTKNGDVVFNLANGSVLNFTGANNAGMYVAKNAGVGGNIYLRSDAVMNANTGNGIQIEHLGTGKVIALNDVDGVINAQKGIVLNATGSAESLLIQNKGQINSSVAGIELNLNSNTKVAQVDMQGGKIVATAGSGIDVKGQSVMQLQGGEIDVQNAAIGIQLGNALQQKINDTHITVQGNGVGLSALSGTDLSQIAATIDVQSGSNGTGLLIKDGSNANTVLNSGLTLNAAGQNAIRLTGTQAKNLDVDGSIAGNILFESAGNNMLTMRGQQTGNIQMQGGNDVALFKTNSQFNGTLDMGAGDDTLEIESGASLVGNVQLGGGNDQLIFNQVNMNNTPIGQIDGGAGNNLVQMNASQWKLDDSTRLLNFNQFKLVNSNLELATSNNVQNVTFDVDTNSHLVFGQTYQNGFGGTITGAGTVDIQGDVALTNSNDLSGVWAIGTNGHLTVTNFTQFGSAAVDIGGHLTLDGVTSTNQVLTGNGLLSINNVSSEFTFGNQIGQGFTGTVELNNSRMTVIGGNLPALLPATLSLASGGVATVYSNETIGDLQFAGGMVEVAMLGPTASTVLSVNQLSFKDTSGLGNFGTINLLGSAPEDEVSQGNFLDEDDISVQGAIQVLRAQQLSEEGRVLAVTIDGVTPTPRLATRVDSAGNNVEATYDYLAVATNRPELGGAGIYVSYLLKQLNTSSNLVLTTAGSTSRELIAKVTGVGDVTIEAAGERFTLQNEANDYTGATIVRNGTLVLGNDGVLGTTRQLALASGAGADWNGVTQAVGGLDLAENSVLALNDGHLTVTGSGSSAGQITGTGTIAFTGGTTQLLAANTQLDAEVHIDSAATTELQNVQALGNSDLTVDGTLVFKDTQGVFANTLTGAGTLDVQTSTVELAGNNTPFTGVVQIADGATVRAQSVATLGSSTVQNQGQLQVQTAAGTQQTLLAQVQGTGDFLKQGGGVLQVRQQLQHTGQTDVQQGVLALENTSAILGGTGVHIAADAVLTGYGRIQTDVLNDGRLGVADALGVVQNGQGTLTIDGNLQNHATVDLVGAQPGNHLQVQGNYSAHSDLRLSAALAGDDTVIDTVSVAGDTSGHTTVYVTNKGGKGAQTVQGISVVEVQGDSAGTFALANRLVAGAYDYQLLQAGKNWVLQSALMGVRPEVGGYLANQDIAQTMFQQQFADRQQGRDPHTGAWGYVQGQRTESQAAGQIDQTLYQSTMRVGADVWQAQTEQGQWTAGVMAGAGKARSSNTNPLMAARADTNVDGYSVGAYATWQSPATEAEQHSYVDTWVQHAWYDNTLRGSELGTEKYDSRVTSAAVEAGHTVVLLQNPQQTVSLTPSIQFGVYDQNTDNLIESTATRVSDQNHQGLWTKAGTQLSATFTGSGDMVWRPYVGGYWGYQSSTARVRVDGEGFVSNKPKNVLDAQLGVQIQGDKHWNVNLELGGQVGQDDYSQAEGRVGVRYSW